MCQTGCWDTVARVLPVYAMTWRIYAPALVLLVMQGRVAGAPCSTALLLWRRSRQSPELAHCLKTVCSHTAACSLSTANPAHSQDTAAPLAAHLRKGVCWRCWSDILHPPSCPQAQSSADCCSPGERGPLGAVVALSPRSLLKFMAMRMNPPSPPAPGLNSSKYLSMGTASRMSLMKMPAGSMALSWTALDSLTAEGFNADSCKASQAWGRHVLPT